MTTSSNKLDFEFLPETYWPGSRTPEQLLTRIKGKVRRDMARDILAEEGFAGLSAFLARAELAGEDLVMWGRVHPAMMGGEYLPALAEGEVEIARIGLDSTTGDQISIRAQQEDSTIRYRAADEYESTFLLSIETSEVPLTLGELIRLIDESAYDGDCYAGGLVISHLAYNLEGGSDVDDLEGFVSVESAYYQTVLDLWLDQHRFREEE